MAEIRNFLTLTIKTENMIITVNHNVGYTSFSRLRKNIIQSLFLTLTISFFSRKKIIYTTS